MSEWSSLPNAAHIDRVIASVKQHPKIWGAAWDAARTAALRSAWEAAWGEALAATDDANRYAAWDTARRTARKAVWDEELNVTRSAVWTADRIVARNKPVYAVWDAIRALTTYDDCDQYLAMSSEQLRAWATLTEQPAAVLLLPAVVALELIAELETV
jgi:hypothetical protein